MVSHRVPKVIVIGMHVTVPPSSSSRGPVPVMPLTEANKSGTRISIGRVIADGTVLDFIQADPNQKPFRIVINKLALDNIGNNRSLTYQALLSDSLPPGKIRSTGVFGPWNPDDPANTPVKGSYTYQDANLAALGALSGTLSASGKFNGTLQKIETGGSAEVPNFQVANTSHVRKLSTDFHASIDALQGNTTLENIVAHFDNTTLLLTGTIGGLAGKDGKKLSLDISASNGRVEDLLDLVISSKTAPLAGSISFHTRVEVPPGSADFLRRVKLTGDFGVAAGKFADKQTQKIINRLSEGRKQSEKSPEESAGTVLSDVKGHVAASGGIATLSRVSFRVPDATAWMHGTYGLLSPYRIDLHGHLLTDRPSDAATGLKSVLLKAMSPFLKKRQGDKIVPFKITGDYAHTSMGLDLGGLK